MRGCCIFAGSSHPQLVQRICERLGQDPSKVDLKKFANGELAVDLRTSVRDQDVFIVQSGSGQINDNVMELLIMISACKTASARSITAIMPYFPYSRQSKKKAHRGAITARMLANLMKVAGVDHVITIDLHAVQMQGFFKCPVDNLIAEPLIGKWIRQNVPKWSEAVVVSKNPGGTKRVTSLADALNLSFGIVTTDRRRSHTHANSSLQNSAIFESMGSDGTNDRQQLVEEAELQRALTPERQMRSTDFAHRHTNGDLPHRGPNGRQRTVTTMSPGVRTRLVNGNADVPSSPLANSTRPESNASEGESESTLARRSTILGVSQPPRDDDGYEESEGEEDTDEQTRDVITGRLIQGHIVDDDAPSPSRSTRSNSIYGPNHNEMRRSSSDEDPPEHMMRSFISTTSSRMQPPPQGLGGTGDATASDEEEEEALQNPEIETTVTLVGNVRDKPVLIVDDMIDKAGSWIAAAETVVKRGGATKVYCMATHGLFGGDALRELEECDEIEAVVVTNAFPIPKEKLQGVRKLHVLDVSVLLSEAIRRNHHGESISQLYQHYWD